MTARMTAAEAKANQERIAERFDLGHWYGTMLGKCCGVYPKAMSFGSSVSEMAYYQCEVCGKRTEPFEMPWQAREAWDNGDVHYEDGQMGSCEEES